MGKNKGQIARALSWCLLFFLAGGVIPGGAWGSSDENGEDIPPDAKALLKTFPGEKVTLPLVVGRAMKASDSFKAIEATLPAVVVPNLQARALLEPRIIANAARTDDRNEAETPFSPNLLIGNEITLTGSRYFSTGTQAEATVSHGSQEIGFPTAPTYSYFQTQFGVTLAQNLWQDAFGYGTRRALEAGGLLEKAAKEAFRENVQDWLFGLVRVFYQAWLAQQQVEVARGSLNRRDQLLGITRLKVKRGTAEEPDLLQIRSAKFNSEVELKKASQQLGNQWRSLVLTLKLPEEWLKIDPVAIPIELDEPVSEAERACRSGRPTSGYASVEKTALQARAAELNFERLQNAAKPDLELRGSLSSNGVDLSNSGTTFSETFRFINPAWTIGLQFSFPLEQAAGRADAISAFTDMIRTEAQSSIAASDYELEWLNSCLDLKRLQESAKLAEEALQMQTRRVDAEERRFRLGRSSMLAVIQAGDDAAFAHSNLSQLQAELRLSAWNVRKLANAYESYIDELKR